MMKRFALLTVLAALFFGVLGSVAASPADGRPLNYYVRWHPGITYTCAHHELDTTDPYLDYNVSSTAVIHEVFTYDSSYGRNVVNARFSLSNSPGSEKLFTAPDVGFSIGTGSYPVTLTAVFTT